MTPAGELIWKSVRLYRERPGSRHREYVGTLVENTGGWAAWAKGVRLGSWGDMAGARRALEEYARIVPQPRNQTQYLKCIHKDAK